MILFPGYLDQLRRRQWNWLEHKLRSDDRIAKLDCAERTETSAKASNVYHTIVCFAFEAV